MKNNILKLIFILVLVSGCASTPKTTKLVVWETQDIGRPYNVIGPVSISEQMTESTEDMVQGIAGFVSKDGRVSDQMPADMKTALEVKRLKYKEMIYEKLGNKAKEYDADAIISGEYTYIPPYASFSSKATVTAKGMMIKYK